MNNEVCYCSTTVIRSYFLKSYSLTCFLQSSSQFPTYVPESYSWKMLSGSETGVMLCLWWLWSQLKTIYSVPLKKEDHKKSANIPIWKKKRKEIKQQFADYHSSWSLQSVFLVSDVCPRSATVTSYYILSLVTIRGREHSKNSGCRLIIATRNTQFSCPLPLVHDLVFCRCTEKTLRRMRKGLLTFFKRKKFSGCGARPKKTTSSVGLWQSQSMVARGIEISWSSFLAV